MIKKGGELEILAVEFLDSIFTELSFTVVRKRIQLSGTQNGYDNLVEIVDKKYLNRAIYTECKDYTTELNYTDAVIKLPQIASTHEKIDLVLFISPRKDFTNIFEETKNRPFLESLGKTHFKVAFLSPETDIERYFSLYPEIYKKAYQREAPVLTEFERENILNQFDKFIFSNKNLHKIIIEESDKKKYIGNNEFDPYHIKRSIRESQPRLNEFQFHNIDKKTLLSEIYGKENNVGLILLGNPGFGKTSELKQLSVKLWNSRETQNIIPVFQSLKNFTSTSRIEDFLPEHFKMIPRQLIIFDGIDEIENIIDFSSKLRKFIIDNKSLFDDDTIRMILSCRTNIYKKYIKNISELGIYFLNEISLWEGIDFLKTKYSLDTENHKTFDIYKNKEILETPFYLDLIGNYYKKHGLILTNKAILLAESVNSRLHDDKENKFRNDPAFDSERIISYTKKIAFALEAMQKTSLSALEIKRAASIDEESLAKNPFIEESLTGSWSFVFKNFQEYFVASILSEMSFEEIIQLIQIDEGTNKVHPTWHNVVTFLLNLLTDDTVYKPLVDWLIENDCELLFNADSDRISDELKFKVLKNIFTKNCIKDNLWIDDLNNTAAFSECPDSIDYLISQALDITIHRRARMSALKMLSYMNISGPFLNDIKTLIVTIINGKELEDEHYSYIVQDAVLLTKTTGINEDAVFFNQLISMLKENDNREIISSVISCVPVQSLNENLEYFFEILDKCIGIKQWKTASTYTATVSTKDKIFTLFSKIQYGDSLLKIYRFCIERQKNHAFKDSLTKEFLAHATSFFASKKQFYADLTKIISDAVINDTVHYYHDGLLLDVVKACNIERELFDIIIESVSGDSESVHFLAAIISLGDFEKISQKYNDGAFSDGFLERLRNVLSNRDFSMSKKFEDYLESRCSYIFPEKYSEEDFNESNNFRTVRWQKNFDVLFDPSEIEKEILKIYAYLQTNELSYDDLDKFRRSYYKDLELQKNITDNSKQILNEILVHKYSDDKKLNIKQAAKEISNWSLDIVQDILNSLPKDKKNGFIVISEQQKEYIKNWCDANTAAAKDFYLNNLAQGITKRTKEFTLIETIYSFQQYFKFELDEELLLDMLWFNSLEDGIKTDYLDNIISLDKVNERLKLNITKLNLTPQNFCNHLKYLRENKISIKELGLDLKAKVYSFLEGGHYYYAGEIIENFFNKDLETLKELLKCNSPVNIETKRFLYDCVTDLLAKENREDIAQEFIIAELSKLTAEKIYTENEITRKLINLNYSDAFDRYHVQVKKQIDQNITGEFSFRQQEWQKFSQEKAIDVLVATFELCLLSPQADTLFGDHYSPVRICSETIISICKAGSEDSCVKTINLLEAIDSEKIKNQNLDVFYLNKLKNDVAEIYYSHRSKPYKIKEVLEILDHNKFLFI